MVSNGAAYFYHYNGIGTSTMTTDWAGGVAMDELFYPFGETWTYVGSVNGAHFASLPNSEPDYPNFYKADARYYHEYLDRWLSPDPAGGDITNPQSLNRYAYVGNNPTTLIDPLGLDSCRVTDTCGGQQSNGGFNDAKASTPPCYGIGLFAGACLPSNYSQEAAAAEAQYEVNNNLCGFSGCGGVTYTQGGLTYTWVPGASSQSGDLIQISTGYWASSIAQGDPWCSSATCLGFLQGLGNFSSGAADILTLSGTYWAQRAMGTNSVVKRNGAAYYTGAVVGTAVAVGIGEELANAPNYLNFRVALDPADHYFPELGGRFVHFQINWWRAGIPGSGAGNVIRYAMPWWPFPWP